MPGPERRPGRPAPPAARGAPLPLPHPECGYVTAETAVVVPALVLLLGMLLWGVAAAVGHIQCVDGARTGARAVARGESAPAVRTAVREVAPRGATVATRREGRLVRVHVRARTAGPGPLTAELHAEAVAFAEAPPARKSRAPGTAPRGAAARASAERALTPPGVTPLEPGRVPE